MLNPKEIAEIKRWNPDEIMRSGKNTLTFMWSPTGGLFVGWPMDHDPTRPDRKLHQPFRPNHSELMMMDPDFDAKFFRGRDDILEILKKEPHKQRAYLDLYGLSGRYGEIMVPAVGGTQRSIIGFWPSENFNKYAHKIINDCAATFKLKAEDIVYPWKSEPMTVAQVLEGQGESKDDCMLRYAVFNINGRQVDIGTIISDLHNLSREEKNKITGPFCDQYPEVRRRCEKNGCQHLLGILDDCYKRLGCNTVSYPARLNAGARIMGGDLKTRLADPDRHYRSQKELNAAWDDYRSLRADRKESVSFRMFFDKIALDEGRGRWKLKSDIQSN